MVSTSNKSQLQLALQTFEKDFHFSINEAVQFYNIFRTTLSIQIKGRSIHINAMANLRKLTVLKEKVIVQKVFDLNSRGFPLRIRDMEDIANRLLTIYDIIYVGLRWASNFVKRQSKLYIRWNRPYD